jgi:hypothetical protein
MHDQYIQKNTITTIKNGLMKTKLILVSMRTGIDLPLIQQGIDSNNWHRISKYIYIIKDHL